MEKERILYPCYFDAALKRREGRRVPLSGAVDQPSLKDLEKALKKMGLGARIESASHPGHWIERGGRVAVTWDGSKEQLIKKVAAALGRRR